VNPWPTSIFPPKAWESSKLSIGYFISLTLSHLMKFPCVFMLFKVHSDIKLSNYFIVPILFESQDISQVLGLTSCNDSVKDGIVLALHVGPINPLRICHWFALRSDHRLIEVLLKQRVKSVVIGISRLCTSKDPSIFPHRLSLALLANSRPQCRV
jgi:hypothetical protein